MNNERERYVRLKGELVFRRKTPIKTDNPDFDAFVNDEERTNHEEVIYLPTEFIKDMKDTVENMKTEVSSLTQEVKDLNILVHALVFQPGSEYAKSLSEEWVNKKLIQK